MRILERLVERPPGLFRALFPGAHFRLPGRAGDQAGDAPNAGDQAGDASNAGDQAAAPQSAGDVYLTFDDGPIPEATPLVLDILDRYGVKATFFMVGQNVERYPELLEEVRRRGHCVGNHTHHHLQGRLATTEEYLADVAEADALIGSRLFRPPHGWLRPGQLRELRKSHEVIMYDLVTRDYSRRTDARRVVENVDALVRDGSIIVFHDSLKSLPKLPEALPASIELLLGRGFRLRRMEEN